MNNLHTKPDQPGGPIWPIIGALALSFIVLHVVAPFSFPQPFADEGWFLLPAMNFALHGSLSADHTLIREIHWMPPASFILDGLALAAAPTPSLRVARAVSFACIAVAAFLLRRILARVTGADTPFTLCAVIAWLLCYPVAVAGNLVRPEALSICLSLATLQCMLSNRRLAAAGFAILSMLTHPLLAIPALLTCLAGASDLRWARPRNWEWGIAALALALLTWEIARFAADSSTYIDQLRYQIHHKVERRGRLADVLTAALGISVIPIAISLRRGESAGVTPLRRLTALFGFATLGIFAFSTASFYLPLVPTGLICLAGALCARSEPGSGRSALSPPRAALALSLLVCLAVPGTWLATAYSVPYTGFAPRLRPFDGTPQTPVDLAMAARELLRDGTPHRVLVKPAYYYAFLTDRDPTGLDAWTWYPFAREFRGDFDKAVISRGLSTPFLNGFVCLRATTLVPPQGISALEIDDLAASPDGPDTPFRPCR